MRGKSVEKISGTELWATMCIYITASAMVVPVGALAGQQSWIAIILSIIIGLVYALIYAHLCDLHPGKAIIEIAEALIGKWGGRFVGLVYAWAGFHLSAMVLGDHWQFTKTVALPNTPLIIIAGTMAVMVVWIVYEGIEAIARVSLIFIPVVFFYTFISFTLLSKDMDIRNLLPVFGNNWREVLYSSFQISTLPLGESVLFVMVFQHLNKGQAKAPSLLGIAVSGIIILITNIMNILVLGNLVPKAAYSTYTAYSYIQVADFLDRAEILIYTIFITMIYIKISIAFYAAALSIAKIFNAKDYRAFLIPLGILMLELSTFAYQSTANIVHWITYVWPFYAVPFQLFIPLLLLIISVVRNGK